MFFLQKEAKKMFSAISEMHWEEVQRLHKDYAETLTGLRDEIARLKKQEIKPLKEVKTKTAIYPLSADPIHHGHVYTLRYAAESGFFDKIYFAIGVNPFKKTLFSINERKNLAKRVLDAENLGDKVEIISYEGLLRNYAKKNGIDYVVRGYRDGKDAEYEAELAIFNSEYGLKTWVVPPTKGSQGISSSMVKAAVSEFAFVHKEVHPVVKQALEEKIRGVSLVGVTGNMGCGKTTLCQKLVDYSKSQTERVNHIDFDKLVHSLYFEDSGLGREVREKIRYNFGEDLFERDNLNRKKLATLVFGDKQKRDTLAEILRAPTMIKLEETLRQMNGIVLVDAAYLVEYNMLPLVNYNVLFVSCEENEKNARVLRRDGISKEDLENRLKAQHSQETKRKLIKEKQNSVKHGFFCEVDTTKDYDVKEVYTKLVKGFPLLRESK